MVFNFGKKKGLAALDIGNSSAKCVDVTKRFGKTSLKKFSFSPHRENSFQNGEILDSGQLSSGLKVALSGFPNNVAFALCGSSMMVKKIKIPKMDEDFISEQIRWEAEQYIPFNIDDVNIDYVVLETPPKSDFMFLLLVAVQKDKVSSYVNMLSGTGHVPYLADVTGFALANCFTFNYPEESGSVLALIDIGAFYTNLIVMDQGKVEYYRDINFGGSKFDEELSKNLGISIKEAKELKESAISNKDSLPDIAADTLMSVSQKLAEQVLGSLEFFRNTDGFSKDIQKIYVTGGGSLALGVNESLESVVGCAVNYMDIFKNIEVSSKVLKSASELNLQYKSAVAMGLALREL